jgi:hypothetical protein
MKVFIIGAARSGTKLLRDTLAEVSGANKIPYDINYIWRWGNEDLPHDQLGPEHYSDKFHKKIDSYLESYVKSSNSVLFEKTVSNTIRVPFLLKHYPDARFIFLYRNPYDVIESVSRQWYKKTDKRYLLEKLKSVPFELILGYGRKFFLRNLNRNGNNFYFWGVKYPQIDDDLASLKLYEVIAKQWQYCFEASKNAESIVAEDRKYILTYEEFVQKPKEVVSNILNTLGIDIKGDWKALEKVRIDSLGHGKDKIPVDDLRLVEKIIDTSKFK